MPPENDSWVPETVPNLTETLSISLIAIQETWAQLADFPVMLLFLRTKLVCSVERAFRDRYLFLFLWLLLLLVALH